MADNFDMKKFLAENKLGAYSRLKEGYMGTQYDSSEDMAVDMVKKGITEKDDVAKADEVTAEEKVEETLANDDLIYDRMLDVDQEQLVSSILDAAENTPEIKLTDYLNKEWGYSEEEEAFGGINEGISPQAFQRMSGLVKETSVRQMLMAAEDMMNDLQADGFEADEIHEFFNQLIINDI